MKYLNKNLLVIFNLWIMIFQVPSFALYNNDNFIEPEFNFDSQDFNTNLSESHIPAILFATNKEEACIIFLDNKTRQNLITNEVEKSSHTPFSLHVKQNKGFKLCDPKITQIVLNSMENKIEGKATDQLAVAIPPFVLGVAYITVCTGIDIITTKRDKVVSFEDYSKMNSEEFFTRYIAGAVCLPIYGLSTFIRWGTNDGHDPRQDKSDKE